MKSLITALFITMASGAFAQSYKEDSINLAQTINWFEEKLTYYYYNVDDDEWWINRFTFNDQSKTITIKNIASPNIQAVSDKTYLQLDFRLKDLNPYAITVEDRPVNAGRLVKGKTIRVGAYDGKAIRRTRNGRHSTHQSFIYFSIPDFFEDSVQNYSQNIADQFKSAIYLATKIYQSADPKENISKIRSILYGRFKSGDEYWVIRTPLADTFEILVLNQELELTGKHYMTLQDNPPPSIGLSLYIDELNQEEYQLQMNPQNGLEFTVDAMALRFETINQFSFSIAGETKLFVRDWTFDPAKARYR